MTTIFLLPYGGASASTFRAYVDSFPRAAGRVVPVELPGRGKRLNEPSAGSIQECASLALEQIDTTAGGYILHGHCMGALLAFEAIKLIEANGGKPPSFMVASGRNAPRHVNAWLRRVVDLDDRDFLTELQQIGGVPKGLGLAMARQFLSLIRNDQAMARDYDPGETRIDVPILVLASRDDAMTHPAGLADWHRCTSRQVSIQWMEGRHHFILDQSAAVAGHIEAFARSLQHAPPAIGPAAAASREGGLTAADAPRQQRAAMLRQA